MNFNSFQSENKMIFFLKLWTLFLVANVQGFLTWDKFKFDSLKLKPTWHKSILCKRCMSGVNLQSKLRLGTIPITEVKSSGAELPAAMKVAPATSSLRLRRCETKTGGVKSGVGLQAENCRHFLKSGKREVTWTDLAQLLQGGNEVVVADKGQGTEHVDSLTWGDRGKAHYEEEMDRQTDRQTI